MNPVLALFGKSPFGPLQAHMEKVEACVELLTPVFAALGTDEKTLKDLVARVCELESEADGIKDDIRANLPKSMFLPVARGDILELLTLQDFIADRCQDIAVTVSLRPLSIHAELRQPLETLLVEVTKTCGQAASIVKQLDELLETGFGGTEAEKVLAMIDKLKTDETIADSAGIALAQKLLSLETELGPVDVMLLYQVFRELGTVADLAEGIGNRLRLIVAK